MPDRVFVDSNVFIYAKIKSQSAIKHAAAQSLLSSLDKRVVISVQVLNEFYSALRRMRIEDAIIQNSLNQFIPSTEVQPLTRSTVELCWAMLNKYHFSYYDSLILASALESKCTRLYSEDMQHGQNIENQLMIVNPFVT
jgi:predicted nucleic acid-binding protein